MADLPAAIVLAGGMARRMGGTDKLALPLAGTTLLDRVLTAASSMSRPVVVVGPERPCAVPDVAFVREEPPGGGPVPAVRAGLRGLNAVPGLRGLNAVPGLRGLNAVTPLELVGEAEVVLVLAGDLPFLTADALRRLVEVLAHDPQAEAVAAADDVGRPNPLLAAYRGPALRGATRQVGSGSGVAASRLLPQAVKVIDLGPETTLNVNSPQDLEQAARLASKR